MTTNPESLLAVTQMLLYCPKCGLQHIDEPDERTPDWQNPPHKSHLCHGCGCIWRPADVPTEGVKAIQTIGKADTWTPDLATRPAPPAQPGREEVVPKATGLKGDDVLAFLGSAFRNIDLPPLGRDDVAEIGEALDRFIARRQPAAEPLLAHPKAEPVACPCCKAPCVVESQSAYSVTLEDENGDYYTEHRLGRKVYRYAEPASVREKMIVDFLRERAGSYDADGNEGDIFALVSAADAIERGEYRAALSTLEPKL